ncbi:hypothetical protein [Streptomyces sp. NPDC055632]
MADSSTEKARKAAGSMFDDFLLSADNDPHTAMTPAVGEWVLDRLPD